MRFDPSALVIRGMLILAVLIVALNLLALGQQYPGFLMLAAGCYAYRQYRMRWQGDCYAYGTARVSGLADLWRRGLLGGRGLIVGTCGYMERPTRRQGVRALFSPRLPSSLAVRLFFAAFFGQRWMER